MFLPLRAAPKEEHIRSDIMEQKKIDRINELARLSRERDLTEEEKAEQKALRREYIEAMKQSLINQLDNTSLLYPDGHKEKLSDKRKDK